MTSEPRITGPSRLEREERVRGCFLGAALGDALGAAVEDTPYAEIKQRYGPEGITQLQRAVGRRGAITDATQTLLFTAEGLMRTITRATVRGKASVVVPELMVWMAYRRWSHTQGQFIEGSYDAAGVFATMLGAAAAGRKLEAAAHEALKLAERRTVHVDVIRPLRTAIAYAGGNYAVDELPDEWRGYIAEEALAIAVYSALSAGDFVSGVRLAVNHSGNSDATGAICGALLGSHHGASELPEEWLDLLEARGTIELVATDFARIVDRGRGPTLKDDQLYPGQ